MIVTHQTSTRIHSVSELAELLDSIGRPATSAELLALTQRLQISRDGLGDYIVFHPRQFSCHPIYRSPHFELSCLCWLGGQRSSIHDHGGSACCVYVVDGTLTDTDFVRRPDGRMAEFSRRRLAPGQFVARNGSQIHRCANENVPSSELVTLHLYSPPLAPLSERAYGEQR